MTEQLPLKSEDRGYSLLLLKTPALTSVTCLVFDPPIHSERKRFGPKQSFITSVMTTARNQRSTAATEPVAAGVSSERENKTPATPTHHLMVDGDSSQSTSAQSSSTSALSGSRRSTKKSSNESGAPAETSASVTLEANKDYNVEMEESKVSAIKPNTRGRNGIRKMTSRVSYC
jgi:activator of HSP90 ATPase